MEAEPSVLPSGVQATAITVSLCCLPPSRALRSRDAASQLQRRTT